MSRKGTEATSSSTRLASSRIGGVSTFTLHCVFHCHTLGVYLEQAYQKRQQKQLELELKKAEDEKVKLKQQVDKEVELRLKKEKGLGSKFNPEIFLEA